MVSFIRLFVEFLIVHPGSLSFFSPGMFVPCQSQEPSVCFSGLPRSVATSFQVIGCAGKVHIRQVSTGRKQRDAILSNLIGHCRKISARIHGQPTEGDNPLVKQQFVGLATVCRITA
jgi:hypothetical protein